MTHSPSGAELSKAQEEAKDVSASSGHFRPIGSQRQGMPHTLAQPNRAGRNMFKPRRLSQGCGFKGWGGGKTIVQPVNDGGRTRTLARGGKDY